MTCTQKMIAVWALLASACSATEDTDRAISATDASTDASADASADTGAGAHLDVDVPANADDAFGPAVDGVGADATGALLCPPQGATGAAVGDVAPALTWRDCEGNLYDLRALCEVEAVWVVMFAGWCPLCRQFAPQVNDFARPFSEASPQGFAPFFLITETAQYTAPDAAYCAQIRDQYGIQVPVLYEADGATQQALGVRNNDVNLVLGRGNRIVFKAQYADTDDVAAALWSLLAPVTSP